MAGHSQFKNIMYRKGAQDIKRARMFARLSREITVAARSGLPDPGSNPRLRAALASARSANMPKDNMERALKKATSGADTTNYEEIRYEGYGPGGIAVIVEAMTDNRNRTASDIRSIFTKYGGALGETGSVSFQFEHIGYLAFNPQLHKFNDLFEASIEAGAENVEACEDRIEVTCDFHSFSHIRDHLISKIGDALESKLIWKALNEIIPQDKEKLLKFLDILDDQDDVQDVFSNAHFDT